MVATPSAATPSAAASPPGGGTETSITTSTSVSTPSPISDPSHADVVVSALVSGAVIAAVVGATVNIGLARRKSREEERSRIRMTFAEAFEVVAQYKEFPYAIRRRRADRPADERVRLSEEMRAVQTRLSYYLAWTKTESEEVGQSYQTLVRKLRAIAGRACHDAWLAPATDDDAAMNFAPGIVDLSELSQYEQAYVATVQQHLTEMLRLRRLWRRP